MQIDFELRPGEDLPHSAHRRLREEGPVVWSEPLDGWLACSYETVRAVLGDVGRFTMAGTPVAESLGEQGMLVNDTPLHHTIRAVWARHVSREAMEARADEIAAYARAELDAVRPRLEAGESVNLIPVFREFVMRFVAATFGVPREAMDVFQTWSDLSADAPALGLEEGSPAWKRHGEAKAAVYELVDAQIADRKRRLAAGESPRDLIALMVAAEGIDGITAGIVADNIFNFILGSLDTTEKWLGNILMKLYGDPALLAEVSADRSLVEAFNEEVMRFDTVAQTVQRRVRIDGVELGGKALKAGDAVYAMLGVANRDGAEFKDPDSFDMHRTVKSHMGFGFGFHHCLGVNIARQEARAFVNTVLDMFPRLRIDSTDFGNTWALWGPRAIHASLPTGD